MLDWKSTKKYNKVSEWRGKKRIYSIYNYIYLREGYIVTAKKNSKKYYAIKVGKGVKNKIVTTWKECSELVLGFNSIYKSFKTREEAEQYLNGIKDNSIDIVLEKNKKAREYNTKKNKSTRSLQGIRIDKELYDRFQEKCNKFEFTEEKAITLLIEEWLS